ncbi:MAG: hypothetical protein M1812_005476 [Candelaria pacifica]|nr:MAG: hypothetical protein M1812_005476 [Candelaria pacifica]
MSSSSVDNEPLPFTELMKLERLDEVNFRSIAPPFAPWNAAYGGHVYAQGAYAAAHTVKVGFVLHNMTGFFTLPGRIDRPFVYTVSRIRTGSTFCTRSVKVTQDEEGAEVCFSALCSFKRDEENPIEHGESMDIAHRYTSVLEGKQPDDHAPAPAVDCPWFWDYAAQYNPTITFPGLDIRKVDMTAYNKSLPPISHHQLHLYRSIGSIPASDLNLHACAHLYASDRNSLFLITNSLGLGNNFSALASISHTVVFHVPSKNLMVREGEWFCQDAHSERSGSGRGLHMSKICDSNQIHIASTLQDGLVRAANLADRSGLLVDKQEGKEEKIRAKI